MKILALDVASKTGVCVGVPGANPVRALGPWILASLQSSGNFPMPS